MSKLGKKEKQAIVDSNNSGNKVMYNDFRLDANHRSAQIRQNPIDRLLLFLIRQKAPIHNKITIIDG